MASAIAAIAGYLTDGARVTQYSVGLQVGMHVDEARAFFALREALGIRGYATAAEAQLCIAKAMGDDLAVAAEVIIARHAKAE